MEQQGTSTPTGVSASDPMPDRVEHDPKPPVKSGGKPQVNPAEDLLSGPSGRHEVTGCPTGLSGLKPQVPGLGGGNGTPGEQKDPGGKPEGEEEKDPPGAVP
jgi:hypothetical protein